MQEAIVEALFQIPNLTSSSLYAEDEHLGINCCIECKTERKRTYFPLMNKYVLSSACKCDVRRMEEEEKQRERRNRRAMLERAYKRSIMNESLKTASFDNFELRKGTERIVNSAKRFVQEFETQTTGMLIYGKPGNGKSHITAAIHHELDKQGYVSLFLDCSQLFNLAKDTFKQNSKVSLSDIIIAATSCDLLTLDELGSGFLTEYEFNDILFPIINGRQGKPTNYTTNLDLKRLAKWFERDIKGNPLDTDGRLIDRIIGSCDLYENLATSKRQEDAMNRLREGA